MNILKRQRDAVGMSVFSDTVEEHTPSRSSTRHHKLLIHTLEQALKDAAGTTKKTAVANAIHEIAEKIHKRSLVCIFSDMMGNAGSDTSEMFSALQHLKYNKHEVILFHVVDKEKEIDFDFENRPYQFIDVESGEKVKVHSNKVRDATMRPFKNIPKI